MTHVRHPAGRKRGPLPVAAGLLLLGTVVGLGFTTSFVGALQARSAELPVTRPPACSDGMRNGKESDVDCGGPACAPCAAGRVCAADPDCGSGVCIRRSCRAPSCTDGVRNGRESDVDCGGGLPCRACIEGRRCRDDVDCASEDCGGWLQAWSKDPPTCR